MTTNPTFSQAGESMSKRPPPLRDLKADRAASYAKPGE